jgi:hypothetical protein
MSTCTCKTNTTVFDPTKPVQTRDGRKARIICTDGKNEFPIVALVTVAHGIEAGQETLISYKNDGRWSARPDAMPCDLINVPNRHKHADCIIAWANGAEIESRRSVNDCWRKAPLPIWDHEREYRIAPYK